MKRGGPRRGCSPGGSPSLIFRGLPFVVWKDFCVCVSKIYFVKEISSEFLESFKK